jgi:sirohydrochlorin ferrochelatase
LKTGIILFAHGSRVDAANDAVRAMASALARAGGFVQVQVAFLELGRPNLEEAVASVAEGGAARVVIVPYFLTLGLHMERDLPSLVKDISLKYNGLEISVTAPLDGHPALVDVLLDRVRNV